MSYKALTYLVMLVLQSDQVQRIEDNYLLPFTPYMVYQKEDLSIVQFLLPDRKADLTNCMRKLTRKTDLRKIKSSCLELDPLVLEFTSAKFKRWPKHK